MKKLISILAAAALTIICLSSCNKGDERITYLLDDSKITYGDYSQFLNLRTECGTVLTDVTYTYKSKQSELISKLDAVVEKYQKKTLAGNLVLYTTYAESADKAIIKTWTLQQGSVVVEIDPKD